jgi:cellulase (glycosyl hydrolase family 5)
VRGRRTGIALVAILLATIIVPAAVRAGPNRCGTAPPSRSPTWQDGTGAHWFDSRGVWTQGPDGSTFGYAGIDAGHKKLTVDAWTNHSAQIIVSRKKRCVVVGDITRAPNVGEFPIEPPPAIVALPWLRRDGNLFKASDGRTTILRGVDYPYNQEIFVDPYNLTDADFARIASWGMNLLRVRISGYRSGYLLNHKAEPGYWEHLDQIIAAANRHGIYVMLATVTGDLEDMMLTPLAHDRLKFIPGTPNRAWWIAFEGAMFARYKDWPGVVGFDTINEDDSYPPFVHDRVMMGPAHKEIDGELRSRDARHIYFQEPSGWSYWGAEYWPGMMNGVNLRDPNRFYCPKWKPGGNASQDVDVKGKLATQSKAPMFMCEMWIDQADEATLLEWQRDAARAMDARLMGGVRTTYPHASGYGMLKPGGGEVFWIREFARPYPVWAGGRVSSIAYDFAAKRLVVGLALDGSGPTEIYASLARTYPSGFVATSSTGARLVHNGSGVVSASGMSWDGQRIVLPAQGGPVTVTIEPA